MAEESARQSRAEEAANTGRVKRHIFKPSGREVWSVVGRSVDHYIDLDQPYCSCRDFYYQLIRGLEPTCYHIEAAKIAKRTQRYITLTLQDEEYQTILAAIIKDLTAKKKKI